MICDLVRPVLLAAALGGLLCGLALALAGCATPPSPAIVDRACDVWERYDGDIARVRPAEAQAHLDRNNRGHAVYCGTGK